MTTAPLYTTKAHVTGGRDGRGVTSDGRLSVRLTPPRELGGSGEGTNPEQLFGVGYAACFLSALKLVAGQQKIPLPPETAIDVSTTIGKREDGGFQLSVELGVFLPGVSAEDAEDLFFRTHAVCPYTHATKGNIPVVTRLV
ncbi:organic hydroperoxide resistance protein [Frigidibacter sp. MR17.14]|uniref:organic hydroperoxide resistance protein n=1 Tax=Frigidibacter sp. MR17.14 TaxID=3126509 RepID=UPI0030131482